MHNHPVRFTRLPRPRFVRPGIASSLLAFAALASCHGGGGGVTTPQATIRSVSVAVVPSTALPGQDVQFIADSTGTLGANANAHWTFSDGVTLDGQTVQRSFPNSGIQPVHVDVFTGSAVTARGDDAAVILDPMTGAVPELLGLPPLFGDVDVDGDLALADVRCLAQALDDVHTMLSPEAFAAADADLDGDLDEDDLALVSQWVMGSGDAATLMPSSGPPGTLVTLYGAGIGVPGQDVAVDFGGRIVELRPFLQGRIGFFIPFDLDTPGVLGVAPGPRTLELLLDGVPSGSFTFDVEDPGLLPTDPVGMFADLIEEQNTALDSLAVSVEELLRGPFGQLNGVSADECTVVSELLRSIASESRIANGQYVNALRAMDPSIAPLMARALAAAKAPEVLQSIQNANANFAMSRQGAATVLDALCSLEKLVNAWEITNTAAQLTCGAVVAAALGSAFLPGIGLVTATAGVVAALDVWAPTLVLSSAASLVFSILPRVGDEIELDLEGPTPLANGQSVELVPQLTMQGISRICVTGGSFASEKFLDWLVNRVVRQVLSRGPFAPLASLAKLGLGRLYTRIVEGLSKVATGLIQTTPLEEWIGDLAQELCSGSDNWSQIEIDPAGVLTGPTPSIGSLNVPVAGSGLRATYTYFPDPFQPTPPEGILIQADASFCDRPLHGMVEVPIGEASVTITMGDNGNLLDDIFEVFVDGESVLTSSIPVVSTSRTISLTLGDHDLDMAGRAAPDNIGTYFISVQGGQLLNGPPTSGHDLVPGVVHHWTLSVGGTN